MSALEIRAVLRTVAERRADVQAVTEALQFKRAEFSRENEALFDHEKQVRLALEDAEQRARALVYAHYVETSDTAPLPGAVQVKLFDILRYDEAKALAWATEKQMALIPARLDVRAFEKLAKATSIDFVSIEKEPRVTIASTLDPAVLAEADEATPA